jgi:hypothetical protein
MTLNIAEAIAELLPTPPTRLRANSLFWSFTGKGAYRAAKRLNFWASHSPASSNAPRTRISLTST